MKKSLINMSLWIDKYKPINSKDIIGQTTTVKKITQFLTNKKRKNCIILTGKPGIGKTLLAHVILNELGYKIKNIDEDHDLKKSINVTAFFNRQQKIAIIYECDYVKNITEDNKLIKKSRQPIIFICNDEEIEKYKALKKNSETIYMRSPTQSEQIRFLTNILKKEKIKMPKKEIESICEESQGDIRHLLLNAQFWQMGLIEKKDHDDSKDTNNFNMFKMVPHFFDCCISTDEKIDKYFINTQYLPQLLFFNYPKTKVAKIDPIYDKIKKEIKENALNYKIKQAKKEAKKKGEKITKIKKPKIKEEDIAMIYKLNAFSETIGLMSDADQFDQKIHEKQEFGLTPHYKYVMAGACTNCSGMLPEKDIRYTKPKTTVVFTNEWQKRK